MDIYGRIDLLKAAVNDLLAAWDGLDPKWALQSVARANRQLMEIAPECVEQGVQAGMTQRAMAQALDVPESVLRGARKEFGRHG